MAKKKKKNTVGKRRFALSWVPCCSLSCKERTKSLYFCGRRTNCPDLVVCWLTWTTGVSLICCSCCCGWVGGGVTVRSIWSGAAGSGCAGLCPGVAGTEGCISRRGRGCLGACSGWTQLGPVAAEHKIACVDAVRAGGCTVDNLTINPRASLLRWSRFCINMRSQWEWHQMMGFLAGGLKDRWSWRMSQEFVCLLGGFKRHGLTHHKS